MITPTYLPTYLDDVPAVHARACLQLRILAHKPARTAVIRAALLRLNVRSRNAAHGLSYAACCTKLVPARPHAVLRRLESSRVQQSVLEALEQLAVSAQPAIATVSDSHLLTYPTVAHTCLAQSVHRTGGSTV